MSGKPSREPRRPAGRAQDRIHAWVVAFATAVVAASGCSAPDPLGRVAVTGEVFLDGEPLDSGAIMLEPGPVGPSTAVGSTIRAGGFSIPLSEGPVPGLYRVRIYASSRVQAPAPPGTSDRKPRAMVERIPEDYNAKSTRTVEIRSDGRNHLRFEIVARSGGRSAAGDP
ncbi:hypothetical protein [Planctomyces sp. SH-PL62]|uniref:hypothetical protein n=1 Tax=Planctomyces sp. SH-PL62 TaxID=1636152 RepID=UPI00078EDAF1|nr:hypothetical protein [Planctomyces sp. SH-PL62]AMV39918.1 hypothetical protein VT85_20970 [Planctomyces sp. SH-PL62]